MLPIHIVLTLLILGLGLRMALRITYGARGPQEGDIIHRILTILSWGLLVGTMGPLLVVLSGFFGPLVLALIAFAGIIVVQATLTSARQTNLRLIDLARAQDLSIGPKLLTSMARHHRLIRRATLRLAADIETGVPILQAFEKNRRAIPQHAIARLAVADAVGAPKSGLHEAAQAGTTNNEPTIARLLVDRSIYLLLIAGVMVSALVFLFMYILPAFEQIFEEFEGTKALPTQYLFAIANVLEDYIPLIPVLAILCFLFLAILRLFKVPVWKWLASRLYFPQHRGLVLRALALGAEHERPMAGLLNHLADHYTQPWIARRIRRAADRVTHGMAWQNALADAGLLGRADRGVLEAAQRAGNLPWALRTIADRQEERAAARLMTSIEIVFPICLLSLAAIVGFIAIAIFIPLVSIIQSLAV